MSELVSVYKFNMLKSQMFSKIVKIYKIFLELWCVGLYYKMLQELFLDKYTAKNVLNLAKTGKKYSLLVEQYV